MKNSYVRFAVMAVMFLAVSMFTVSCGMKSTTNSKSKSSKSYKKSKSKRMKASEYK